MNWIKRIRTLLGAFWYRLFDDRDFILGVEFLLGEFYKVMGYRLENWLAGMFPMLDTVYPVEMPFVIYLDTSSLHREWYSWRDFVNGDVTVNAGSHIGKPTDAEYISLHSADKGWVIDVVDPIPEPTYMMDHLSNWNLVLTNGADFKFAPGKILFYVDPTTLNIPSVKVTTEKGELKVYLKLIGIVASTANYYDAISGFMSPELNDCADIVWDIYMNGATYYNAKKLLSAVTNNVICDKDGAINDMWIEQGYVFVRVDDRIYGAKRPCNFRVGDNVKNGDILFGTMQFFKGSDQPSSFDIPGIRVRTDAGELVADNDPNMSIIEIDDQKILPLSGEEAVVQKYEEICVERSKDPSCPYIEIPVTGGKVNPYDFVMRVLRKGRTCAVRLTVESAAKLEAAINVLRKCTSLGGLLTIYVGAPYDQNATLEVGYTEIARTTSSASNATSTLPLRNTVVVYPAPNVTVTGFAADAGMGVVAEEVPIPIQIQQAEARLLP